MSVIALPEGFVAKSSFLVGYATHECISSGLWLHMGIGVGFLFLIIVLRRLYYGHSPHTHFFFNFFFSWPFVGDLQWQWSRCAHSSIFRP